MKTQKHIAIVGIWAVFAITLVVLTALSLTGCPPEPHTHDWGNWVQTTAPTATNPGEETRTCNTCGEKVTRPIPATSNPDPTHTHEYATTWSSDATQHWKECTANDGAKIDVGNHDGDPCTVCGYTETTHTHTYATAWSKDAAQHWKECTANDGAKTDVADHDWGNWQETTAPTTTTEGEATRTCTTCGATETKSIDKLPDPEKPQHSPTVPMFADKTATITTTDIFTDTQWNAIVTAIVDKFVAGYNAASENRKTIYKDAFDRGVTIIVEKNPSGYINYKFTDSDRKLYVRANGVDNLNTNSITTAMDNGTDTIDGTP